MQPIRGNENYTKYLKDVRVNNKFTFSKLDEIVVQETMNSLNKKTSCGFDRISTKLIKSIAPSLLKPLTLLMNQILNT